MFRESWLTSSAPTCAVLGLDTWEMGKITLVFLTHGWRRSFEYLLSWDKLSIFYVDLLHPVDFPFLVELNGGFNIDMLVFGLIVGFVGI